VRGRIAGTKAETYDHGGRLESERPQFVFHRLRLQTVNDLKQSTNGVPNDAA
jgi:hypothetical protein